MNELTFRGELEKRGARDIVWDGENNGVRANIGGKTYFYDTSSLENRNGTLYGSAAQISGILGNPMEQVRNTAVSQGIDVKNSGSKPILNGQEIDTGGMVLSGDRWYANGNALREITEGVKSPYTETKKNIFDELLNYEEFKYDAENDEDLQNAMDFARRQSMRDAVNRGQGSSFGMEYAASAAADSLIPQYREKAYEIYKDERNFLDDLLMLTSDFEENDYERFKENRNFTEQQRQYDEGMNFKEKEQYDDNLLQWAKHKLDGMEYMTGLQQKNFDNALKLSVEMGYVTEENAKILGVEPGVKMLDYLNYLAKLR